MRKLSMTVTEAQAGRSVKSLLRERFCFALSQLSHLKFVPGAVLKNGEAVRLVDPAAAGDCIEVFLEDSGAVEAFPLPVLYEDEDLLILDKPAGMAVHGAAGGAETVESFWRETVGTAFHPVNRLDRGTSGAMVAAKSGYIHDRLRAMLHTADFSRSYLAVVEGEPERERGEINLPLARAEGKTFVSPTGKPALTRYEVLARGEGCALLRLELFTGRTHQIRAHCAAIGHPLLGDGLYGGAEAERVMLHSWRVMVKRPVQGDWIRVEAPLPQDMQRIGEARGIDAVKQLADEKNC